MEEEEIIKKNKKWFKTSWGILLIILLLFVFFIFLLFSYSLTKNFKAEKKIRIEKNLFNTDKNFRKKIIGDNSNPFLGNKDAKIIIVEFLDFSCPVCKNFYPTIREASIKYKKNIKIIIRDYPVISDNSFSLAMAGECAKEQGFFWQMHDKLFQNQKLIKEEKQLNSLAQQIGLDIIKFNACLKQKKYKNIIEKDIKDAVDLKIKGTPTIFINGYKIEGNIPKTILFKIIEDFILNTKNIK